MTVRRAAAKALYRLAGLTACIRTSKMTYEVVSWEPFVTRPDGSVRSPCRFSFVLLGKAMSLDWDHFDHWACVHDRCDPSPCPECGGQVCNTHDLTRFESYLATVEGYRALHPEQRNGQAHYNVLRGQYAAIAEQVTVDPFDDDTMLPAFLTEVARLIGAGGDPQ